MTGRMTLVFSGNNYVHKVLVVASEAGILDRLDFVVNNPIEDGAAIWNYSPLGHHPVLVLEDGLVLYSGLTACEYVDSLNPVPTKRLFPVGPDRWEALSFMVLGDGLFDAVSALSVDALRNPEERRIADLLRNRRRVHLVLERLEAAAHRLQDRRFDIGHVCVAGGLSFLDLRRPLQKLLIEAADANFEWRAACPRLSNWYHSTEGRTSLRLRPRDLGVVGTETAARSI
ncbi:MAG: hypothetical protein O3A21_01205 [Proteobacteria bacterium]|nr:hypothetical protein [Pseudomonadota bacterium]